MLVILALTLLAALGAYGFMPEEPDPVPVPAPSRLSRFSRVARSLGRRRDWLNSEEDRLK